MATQTVTPPSSPVLTSFSNSSSTSTETLIKHHITVSYVILTFLGAALAIGAVGGYLGLKEYGKAVSRAEAIEAQYNTDRKAWEATLAQHDAQRAQDAKDEAALLAQIAQRDKAPVSPVVQEGLKSNATAEAVKNALGAVYSGSTPPVLPEVTQDQKIALEPAAAQELVQTAVSLNKAQADLKDEISLYTLEKQDNSLLTSDLNQCKADLGEANKSIDAWRKAAKKSRWQRFLSKTKEIALIAGAAYLGHRL